MFTSQIYDCCYICAAVFVSQNIQRGWFPWSFLQVIHFTSFHRLNMNCEIWFHRFLFWSHFFPSWLNSYFLSSLHQKGHSSQPPSCQVPWGSCCCHLAPSDQNWSWISVPRKVKLEKAAELHVWAYSINNVISILYQHTTCFQLLMFNLIPAGVKLRPNTRLLQHLSWRYSSHTFHIPTPTTNPAWLVRLHRSYIYL